MRFELWTSFRLALCAISVLSTPVLARADFGSALSFDGIGSFVGTPPIDLSAGNTASFEAWIQPNDLTSTTYSEVIRQQGFATDPDWVFSFKGNGTILYFGLKVGGTYSELLVSINPSDYVDGNWHHIAAVYDGVNQVLYRDGIPIGSAPRSGNVSFTGTTNGIAALMMPAPAEFFNGVIDDVRVWSVALTAADIANNMQRPLTGAEAGLAAYWKFDEGSGTVAGDSSPNGVTGTLINNPAWVVSTVTPPLVLINGPASGVSSNSATINGTIFPRGIPTSANFQYGADTNYGSQTASQDVGPGPGPVVISNALSGLIFAHGYHYQLMVQDTNGSASLDKIFFTLGNGGGTALKFNGTNSYVRLPAINLGGGSGLTLQAWIQPTNLSSNAYSEILRQQGSGYPDYLLSFQDHGYTLSFGVKTAGGYQELHVPVNPADFGDGNWHALAATYDGTNSRLYADGIPIGSATNQSGNVTYSSSIAAIGASPSGPAEFFNGVIDEVRVWNVALSATQLTQLLNSEITGGESGLVAYYRFDEGAGTLANDLSGGGHNGTLFNGPVWVNSTAPLVSGPSALTGYATNVAANSATLTATVTPAGFVTTVYFKYGLTTNYGARTAPQSIGSGVGAVPASSPASGLLPGTLYHYRAFASNSLTTINGQDRIFFTAGTLAGKALNFNGSNSYVRLPVIDFSGSNTFTLEAWIRPADITTALNSTIACQQAFSTTDWLVGFEAHGSILAFGLRTGNLYQELQAPIKPGDLADGNWHHVVATYDGTTKRLYVDGVLIGSASQSGNVAFTATNNSIGASYNGVSGSSFFNGQIDEVRIWGVPRSAAEINQYLNRSLTGVEPGLAAYYRFDEGAGSTANDATPNARAGILVNNPAWVNSSAPLLPLVISLSGFSPGLGNQGTSVTITGTNLLAVAAVLFNGVSASFVTNSNSSITASVPPGATTGPITLVSAYNTSVSANTFLVDNTPPSVSIATPANATFITSLSILRALASDNVGGSGVSSVAFYIQRESDFNFWTGAGWAQPSALAAALSGGQWVRNSGLPSGASLNDGAYTIYAVAYDGVGNSSIVNVEVTVNKAGSIVPIHRLANGHMQLDFAGIPGKTYRVQASTNLAAWSDIGSVTVDSSGTLQFEDANAAAFRTRFYRTVTP
jgi:hypothetical protein